MQVLTGEKEESEKSEKSEKSVKLYYTIIKEINFLYSEDLERDLNGEILQVKVFKLNRNV